MPWVNRRGYNGKRHWVEGVEREWGEVKVRDTDRDGVVYTYRYFTDRTTTPPLCASSYGNWQPRPWAQNGYVFERSDNHPGHISGGISSKEQINLLQSNICVSCRKKYIASRPELRAAVEAVEKAQVMS